MLKKRLIVFAAGLILVGLLITVTVFIRTPHLFVLDMTPSGSMPMNSPSPSQTPTPSMSFSMPPSPSQTPTPSMSFSMPPSPSGSPTPSMSTSPTPGGGPYDILSEGDLDIEVSGAHGIIHVKWHTTSAMTGVKTIYLGIKGGSPSFSFTVDLSQGSGEYDISGPMPGGPPAPQMRLQTGYCYIDFYFDRYSVEVDFPIGINCYEIIPPPQEKSGIFGYVYDDNDPDDSKISGAAVTLEDAGGWAVYPGTIYSNANGEYQYSNVNPGTFYKLIVMKMGYERKEIPNITLQAGVEKNVNVGLMPQAPPKDKFTFTANVYDTQDNNFASDVHISLQSGNIPGSAWMTSSSGANIDPAKYGNYTNLVIKDIPLTQPTVNIYHFTGTTESPFYDDSSFDFYVNVDQLTFDYNANAYVVHKDIPLAPRPTLTIKCKVINSLTGEGIEGAKVKIENLALDWEISGDTGTGGVAWIYNYPIDDGAVIHAEASYPHFKTDEGDTAFHYSDAGSTYLFNFSLIPIQGQYIYGRVMDGNSHHAVTGARVSLVKNGLLTDKTATTNEYGRYYITDPGAGDMVVVALHPDYYDNAQSRKAITLGPNEDKEVNFRIKPFTSSLPDSFDLKINHVYKLENGTQVPIGHDDLAEVIITNAPDVDNPTPTVFSQYKDIGPKVPFHTFSKLPIGKIRIKATIYNPSTNDPGWIPSYETELIISQATTDTRTVDLVLEPLLVPPEYSGGAIINGVTHLKDSDCYENCPTQYGTVSDYVTAPKGIKIILYTASMELIQQVNTDSFGQYKFTGVPNGSYLIKANSVNYTSDVVAVSIDHKSDVKFRTLTLRGKTSGYIKTRNYGGTQVTFVGFGSFVYIGGDVKWLAEINKIKQIRDKINPSLEVPKIYVVESSVNNAMYDKNDQCGDRIIITTKYLEEALKSNSDVIAVTLLHEFGHYVNARNLSNQQTYLNNAFAAAQDVSPCPFVRINDTNLSFDFLAMDHPQDNAGEYFSSFFTAYFNHHDRLLDQIKNNTTDECQRVLGYTWQWFSENVGKNYPNDDQLFHVINGSLGGTLYTPNQIKNGDWIDPSYR
jgi:hypothetical protein